MLSRADQQKSVEAFWNQKPCDSDRSARERGSREYFMEIERDRYSLQEHIPRVLDKIEWRGKSVLEIGTGVGTDARQLIRRGANYHGINVDQGSADITARALSSFSLPGRVEQMSATQMCFADHSFDAVYSYGVLHHVPDVERALREIHRVLKPGGELLMMVYNRSSINYYVEILLLRKMFLRLLGLPGATALLGLLGFPRDKLARHRELYRHSRSMSAQEWLSRNTDGPDNPYSRVYGKTEVQRLLRNFEILSNEVYFFDHRHWGIVGRLLPRSMVRALGRWWGWHRVVHARKPD